MRRKVMLKEVISVVKLSLIPAWGWPLSRDATRLKVFGMKLYHCLSITLVIGLLAPLIYGITNHLDDSFILMKTLPITSGLFHVIWNIIFYRLNCQSIQNVSVKMEHFSDFMKLHEEIIIQRFINKCILFYGTSLLIIYLSVVGVVIVPTVIDQPFPTFAEYPFDVYYQPLRTIIYAHQSIVGIIIGGQLSINIFMALLLWFASARFEILSEELRTVTTIHQLVKCIKIHQELLQYARDITTVVRPFAFSTICCSTFSIIMTFLVCITNQPPAVIIEFLVLAATCLSEVFIYTWPGEYLIYTSEVVAEVVFHTLENNHLTAIQKSLQIIMMRSQKPIKVSIPCFLPALSLNYFSTYLSTVFSYFTTLRVMMDDDKNKK